MQSQKGARCPESAVVAGGLVWRHPRAARRASIGRGCRPGSCTHLNHSNSPISGRGPAPPARKAPSESAARQATQQPAGKLGAVMYPLIPGRRNLGRNTCVQCTMQAVRQFRRRECLMYPLRVADSELIFCLRCT